MSCLKFSIIVPVYNVERYLCNCIESVLSQSFSNFELILVDDGSQDDSGNICDKYALENNKVNVVHKDNGGLSSARNAGLEIAKGEYIIFLDSDDFWDDEYALENINNCLLESQADLLVFPAKRYYENTNEYTYTINKSVSRDKIIDKDVNKSIKYLLQNNIYRAAAWNKVVKREIVYKNQMKFKSGYLSEDMDWCGDLLLFCNSFDFYDNPLYAYRQQRKDSITSVKSTKLVEDKLYMCKKGFEQSLNYEDKDRGYLLANYYAYEYAVLIGISSKVKDKFLLEEIENMKHILKYDICRKVKLTNILCNCVGFKLTRKVLCLFVEVKK